MWARCVSGSIAERAGRRPGPEQRLEPLLGLTGAAQPHTATGTALLPCVARRRVTLEAVLRLDFDHVAAHAHRAHGARGLPRLEHRDEPHAPSPRPENVERPSLPALRAARTFGPQQLAVAVEIRSQHPTVRRQLEDDGLLPRGHETLAPAHE